MGAAFRTLNRSYEAGHAIGVVVGVVAAVLAAGVGAAVVPQATATSERIRSVSALLMCRTLPERGRPWRGRRRRSPGASVVDM